MARSPVSGAQYGLAVSTSVVTLTVPDAANKAEIMVRGDSVAFTRDGTDPTASKGIQANVQDVIMLESRDECVKFETIRVTGNATLDVEYFTG